MSKPPSPAPRLSLLIANKNYSTWSLRAWFALHSAGIAFAERRLPLFTEEWRQDVGALSPSGLAPVLTVERDGAEPLRVWDSLAICEYAAETFPDRRLWPADADQRAVARSVSAQMHSGFSALRGAMPMNCRATGRRVEIGAAVARDIDTIVSLWTSCRQRARTGPWLFGELSIADAMFLPVASRFVTYGVDLDGAAGEYAATLLAHPSFEAWQRAAEAETEIVAEDEAG